MYIVNEHGILHSWPDDWALLPGHRLATPHEAGVFLATGEQNTKKMPVALEVAVVQGVASKDALIVQRPSPKSTPVVRPGRGRPRRK